MSKDLHADLGCLLFPGRTSLRIKEIADRLLVTEAHVIHLVERGILERLSSSAGSRSAWRISNASYESFLASRSSIKSGQELSKP